MTLYQRTHLATRTADGPPGPLPEELRGEHPPEALADVSWVRAEGVWQGIGYWPVEAVQEPLNPATEVPGAEGLPVVDPDLPRWIATRGKRPLTAQELAARLPPVPPKLLTPIEFVTLVRTVAGIGNAAYEAIYDDARLRMMWVDMRLATAGVARDSALTAAGLGALVATGHITAEHKAGVLAAWPRG